VCVLTAVCIIVCYRAHERDLGFVLIVDRRNDKWNSLRLLLIRIAVCLSLCLSMSVSVSVCFFLSLCVPVCVFLSLLYLYYRTRAVAKWPVIGRLLALRGGAKGWSSSRELNLQPVDHMSDTLTTALELPLLID